MSPCPQISVTHEKNCQHLKSRSILARALSLSKQRNVVQVQSSSEVSLENTELFYISIINPTDLIAS
jgi:hypothetical protein